MQNVNTCQEKKDTEVAKFLWERPPLICGRFSTVNYVVL